MLLNNLGEDNGIGLPLLDVIFKYAMMKASLIDASKTNRERNG